MRWDTLILCCIRLRRFCEIVSFMWLSCGRAFKFYHLRPPKINFLDGWFTFFKGKREWFRMRWFLWRFGRFERPFFSIIQSQCEKLSLTLLWRISISRFQIDLVQQKINWTNWLKDLNVIFHCLISFCFCNFLNVTFFWTAQLNKSFELNCC